MSGHSRFVLLASILLLAVAILAYLALDNSPANAPADEPSFRGCSPSEAATEVALAAIPTPTPFGPDISVEVLNQPELARPFVGTLCGFELVATADEAHPQTYCEGNSSFIDGHSAIIPSFVESELNQSQQTEQGLCDGTPIVTYGVEGRAAYFRDAPRVFVGDTPRERLRVEQVDGHTVLIILPRTNPGTYFFHAVKRPSSSSEPGILLTGSFAQSFEEAIAQARARLSQ